jgi:drug/metabolite transporter (DMT)-like permease
MFFVFGLKFTTATISQTLYAGGPLLAGVFSYFLLKEEISMKKILGIIIGFIGTAVIIFGPVINSSSIWNGTLFGNIMLSLAVVSFSLYTVLSKKCNDEYSPISFIKYFVFTTLIVQTLLLIFSPLRNEIASISYISPLAWFSIIFVGFISTTLYYFLYQRVLKTATPVLASMILYLQPLAGIIWARILLNERFTTIFIAGGLLIFTGITLVFYDRYSKHAKVNS